MAPSARSRRLAEALRLLVAVNVPREQQNERSAVTLLALLGLGPTDPWAAASSPLIGVTPIMEFARTKYGLAYAPNTRETFRRFTLHQFVHAGLAVENPDEPTRPPNSPNFCYQASSELLELARRFGAADWALRLREFMGEGGGLGARYAQAREMSQVPLKLPNGKQIKMSGGGQGPLVKAVIEEFCPRFTPGAEALYVGDTSKKFAFYDGERLKALGVVLESHGQIPDVVVWYEAKRWLVLIEAVTSHGPMNPKRVIELKELFGVAKGGLVFVTAFADRPTFRKYLTDIAWETEVWIAEQPDHLIHFNGERFLGPY